jgi:hypothetical protein
LLDEQDPDQVLVSRFGLQNANSFCRIFRNNFDSLIRKFRAFKLLHHTQRKEGSDEILAMYTRHLFESFRRPISLEAYFMGNKKLTCLFHHVRMRLYERTSRKSLLILYTLISFHQSSCAPNPLNPTNLTGSLNRFFTPSVFATLSGFPNSLICSCP